MSCNPIVFNLFHSNHFMVNDRGAGYNMYKNIQYIYMYIAHVDCDIDYGGQAFSYI